jgi:peptidylprolyl isomerase
VRHAAGLALVLLSTMGVVTARAGPASAPYRSVQQLLAEAPAADWRSPDPDRLLYLELASGRVIIELAPAFAPHHVDNVRALAREHYFDGLSINRAQDNYVVQWGDPDETNPRPVQHAHATLAAEFSRTNRGLDFRRLAERDVYAPQVGFVDGFPAARDPVAGQAWLAHCYGMVGAGRDVAADSGGGTELYVVIGHAPRHLDRNVTLLGRVLQGMESLSSLPRGTAEMGFYADPGQRVPIRSARVSADLPEAQRTPIEVLRTDSMTFARVIEARRNRRDDWTKVPAGHVELCNVPLPVRLRP